MDDSLRAVAEADLRYRQWVSLRGKATRAYIRDNNIDEDIDVDKLVGSKTLPEYVTIASIKQELRSKAARREKYRAARAWRLAHPKEATELREKMRKDKE